MQENLHFQIALRYPLCRLKCLVLVSNFLQSLRYGTDLRVNVARIFLATIFLLVSDNNFQFSIGLKSSEYTSENSYCTPCIPNNFFVPNNYRRQRNLLE